MKDNVNKRLCELLGCEPYETYSRLTGLYIEDYPDFADPSGRIDLLKRIWCRDEDDGMIGSGGTRHRGTRGAA